MRSQHESEGGPILRENRSSPFSNHGRSKQIRSSESGDSLRTGQSGFTEAKAAFEHREALAKRRAISQKAIDKSRNAYEQAQARTKHDEATVAQLQAALHAAETDLGYTEIVAPVDGTVVSRNVEIGQTVAAGSEAPPLFLIATDPSAPN